MTRLTAFTVFWLLLVGAVVAVGQTSSRSPTMLGPPQHSCQQAVNFMPRLQPNLTIKYYVPYSNFICGLVSAGIWQRLDVLYIFATTTQVAALTNLVSNSFRGIANGSPTFTPDNGYTGVDSSTTVFVDSQFNGVTASQPNYNSNSAHLAVWVNNQLASSGTGGIAIGVQANGGGAPRSNIIPLFNDGKSYFRTNDTGTTQGATIGDSRGLFIAVRDSNTTEQGYRNGVNVVPSAPVTSSGVQNANIYILANSNGGAGNAQFGAPQQISMASIGGSLTPGQALAYYNLAHAYMQVVAGITY